MKLYKACSGDTKLNHSKQSSLISTRYKVITKNRFELLLQP